MQTTISDALPDDPNAPIGALSGDVTRTGGLTDQVTKQAGATLRFPENPAFQVLLKAIRDIDVKIQNLLAGRVDQSRNMGMAKLAGIKDGSPQLTQDQVNKPDIEAQKIEDMIASLADMTIPSPSQPKIAEFIRQCFPLIFAHSRNIQMGLNYTDPAVQQGVDAYRAGGELEKITKNLRNNITAVDNEFISVILARITYLVWYSAILIPPADVQQLLPRVHSEGSLSVAEDEFLMAIFQQISDLCFHIRGSRGISLGASSWKND